MITLNKTYRFTGSPTAETVYYTWAADNACASVTPVSGEVVSGQTVDFEFTFTDTDCFATTFTLSSYDDKCPTPVTQEYTYSVPCSTLLAPVSNTPSNTNPSVFTVQPSGGVGPYDIKWYFNDAIFKLSGEDTNSSLVLLTRDDGKKLPVSTTITVVVTDTNGCEVTTDYEYVICQPVANSPSARAICVQPIEIGGITSDTWAGGIVLRADGCNGTTIDWDTIELSYSGNIYVQTNVNVMSVFGVSTDTSQTYNIDYTVKNNIGTVSTVGRVTVIIPVCNTSQTGGPVINESQLTKLESGFTSGDTVNLDLTNEIFA